jgi:beta-barrel assembly-enhancing protease
MVGIILGFAIIPSASRYNEIAWRRSNLLAVLVILGLILFFNSDLLPGLGRRLGRQARKPYRQAKWMWSWASGTEDEALEAERDYGRECAREFVKQFSGSAPRKDQELVAMVGGKLGNAVRDPRREFHFSAVSSSTINAFALPGGFVFITEALISLCENDQNEIAFLLGHEIGHILRGHARDKLTASALLNAVIGRPSGAGQMLLQAVSKGYSRTLELEADRESVRLAEAAGFDPRASIRALQRLAHISSDNAGLAEYFSTHPALSERIRELENRTDA